MDASYDPVAWLGRKILRRTKRSALDAALDAPGQYAPTRQEQLDRSADGAGHRRRLRGPRTGARHPPVTRFLSPEWVDAFNEALADVAVATAGARRRRWRCATGASAWARS